MSRLIVTGSGELHVSLAIPALRERNADKILLARYLLKKYTQEQNLKIVGFTEDAINAIEEHFWPGNIRELSNKVTRAAIMCEQKYISAEDLGLKLVNQTPLNLKEVRQNAEVQALKRTLTTTENNVSAAAKLLGITRPTLYDLMKKYNLNQN